MVVHHVKVNPVSTGGQHGFKLIAQAGKVSRQNGRGDAVSRFACTHGQIVAASQPDIFGVDTAVNEALSEALNEAISEAVNISIYP